ncbi:MAG: TVP38/TMEM64 family protein [Thermoanaerobaculia bacterium]
MTTDSGKAGSSAWRWIALGAFGIGLFVAWRLLPVKDWLQGFQAWVSDLGVFGGVLYGVVYVLAALLFVPGSLLTLGAGLAFGLLWGTVIVSAASTVAATLAFLIARYSARDRVAGLAGRYPKFGAIDRAIAEGGWRVVGLLRLSPVVPFSVSNYLYGLTSVRVGSYVLASWAGMLPATVLYVALGAAGRTVGSAENKSPLEWILLAAGILATVAVTIFLARVARGQLRKSQVGRPVAADPAQRLPDIRTGG